jgi:uncharacterized protein (DUF2147 family)
LKTIKFSKLLAILNSILENFGYMKRSLLLNSIILLMLLVYLSASAYALEPDGILGTYWSPDKNGKIEIYNVGDKYYGKIIWGTKSGKDIHNPDPALRDREVIGMVILNDFVYDGNDTWKDGTIYDPQTGKTYNSRMTLDEQGNLQVRGYIGIPLIGRTETFTRIE